MTFSSTGDATDFGDLKTSRQWRSTCFQMQLVDSTWRIWCSGYNHNRFYFTMASLGNAMILVILSYVTALMVEDSANNLQQGIIVIGGDAPTDTNVLLNLLTISTTGNSQDFGDLTTKRSRSGRWRKCNSWITHGLWKPQNHQHQILLIFSQCRLWVMRLILVI